MNFGSKNNFEYILANIGSPDNEYMYEHLYAVLRKDVFELTEFRKVPEADREAVQRIFYPSLQGDQGAKSRRTHRRSLCKNAQRI